MVPTLLWTLTGWLLLMGLASAAGLALVGAWPWAERARRAGVALAVGLACAPLLAGIVMVGTLWALPGAAAMQQLACVYAVLALVAGLGAWAGVLRRNLVPVGELIPHGPAAVLTWAFLVAILLEASTTPMTQADALEFASAARILFDARDLASYPPVQPLRHASGFYGSWAHPPLHASLLTIGFMLQGGSEHTLLARWVAPWCLAGSVACVAALARWANPARPDAGALAALLLVSTPLVFLGAAAGLAEALPLLGLTLTFTAAAALAGTWWQRALSIGLMLGLALWTHAQGVWVAPLVLPLLLLGGAPRLRTRVVQALLVGLPALGVALLLGAAPYWRNLALFGSLTSGNAPVLALPALDWAGYWQAQRDLTGLADRVQYGLLGPWFAIEAFALVFWLALPALAVRRQPLAALQDQAQALRAMSLGLIALYLTGAMAALAIGAAFGGPGERDLLQLLLVPAAALLAAGAMNRPLLRGAVVLLIGLLLVVLVTYRLGQLNAQRRAGEGTTLERWAPHAVLAHLRQPAPLGDDTVLTLKPADMFYSGRTMLSHLDPRLVPFYAEREPAAAAARLRELNVSQVHVPDAGPPTLYHSALEALLANPALAQLSFEAHGYQVYRLQAVAGAPIAATTACGAPLAFGAWQRGREFVLGGRKNLLRLNLGTVPLVAGEESRPWNASALFLRETRTVLRAELALPAAGGASAPAATSALPATQAAIPGPGREWLLQLELAGEGWVQVQVRPRGAGEATRLVAERPFATAQGAQGVQRRLHIDARAQRLDLRLEHRADVPLRVVRAQLMPVCVWPARP